MDDLERDEGGFRMKYMAWLKAGRGVLLGGGKIHKSIAFKSKADAKSWLAQAVETNRGAGRDVAESGITEIIPRKKTNPRRRNGRSYAVKGVSIGIPRYNFDPKKGDVFFIEGKRTTIKRTGMDDDGRTPYVWISPAVDGTFAMSVGNLYQVARVPEDSRFAPYDVRMSVKAGHTKVSNPGLRFLHFKKYSVKCDGKTYGPYATKGKAKKAATAIARVCMKPAGIFGHVNARQGNPMIVGTSYFTSRGAAERYYKDYEGSLAEAKKAVTRKLAAGEIHIGKPPMQPGQRLSTTDGGKRYVITTP